MQIELFKMHFKVFFGLFYYLVFLVNLQSAIRWLAIQHADNIKWNVVNENYKNENNSPFKYYPCMLAKDKYGFTKLQSHICQNYVDLMPSIQNAASLAMETCQNVFQHRRWNCSGIKTAPVLTSDLTRATREQAYVYAISSVALTYSLAKLCNTGSNYHCSCDNHPKDPPNGNFKWGGCSDNLKFGIRFNRRFIDSIEKLNSKLNKTNDFPEKQISQVNLHNNRVGRRVMDKSLTIQCKCHGVSGSCNIKTCWKSLPNIIDIGQKLLRRYTNAVQVTNYSELNKRNLPELPGRKSPTIDQLIYLTKSPDYCTRDARLGSLGTKGRRCNVTSSGTDSCSQLCCGRGYKTFVEEKIERCQCKYHYCCYVVCKTCKTISKVYKCK